MMRIALTAACCLSILIAAPCEAQGAATVGTIADILTGDIQNIINSLGDTVSADSFRLRQQLEILLGQVDSIANGQRDKLFGQLNSSEQKSLTDIQTTITQLNAGVNVTLQNVQATSDAVAVSMSELPFAKETPRVTRYSPSFIVSGATSRPRSAWCDPPSACPP